jgi:hypothetical protein
MILLVMFVALFAAAFEAPTSACDNCNGGGGGWGGWGYDIGYLYNSLDYNVPYFAAHPPVYYSYPVPRTYGYSPFAYPPGTMTPEVLMSDEQPVEIINPYVPKEQQDKARADQQASGAEFTTQPEPLVIINPFVAGAESIAKTGE